MKKKPQHLVIKIHVFLFSRKGSIFSRCERDRRRQTETEGNKCKPPRWPITSLLLTIPSCVIFKDTQLEARCGLFCGTLPQWGAQPLAGTLCDWSNNFWPLQAESNTRLRQSVSHVSICICHFITPTHFRSTTWQVSLIFTGACCAVNLRVTVRSRGNRPQ